MGTVYEAYDEKMRRKVALKVLSRHIAPSRKAGLRFEQEAWIAGKLDHPNLVKVYDRGEWEDLSYYSMELMDGGSLHDVIRNMKQWNRDDVWKLEFGTREYIYWAIRQVITAARGLDYAHRHGVIHRDVKPMNLLLSRELAMIKVADFGLALDETITRLTTEDKMLGTLPYMSPEQIRGRREEIDSRTDVYALGVTLFELLTLQLPYGGTTKELYINAVLTDPARRASKLNQRVSRDLETVIQKALEKSSRDRYQSAAAFADDLENILRLKPIVAQPPGRVTRGWKWTRRKPMHAAVLGMLILGLPTVAILGNWALQRQQMLRQTTSDALWREVRFLHQTQRYQELLEPAARLLDLDPSNVKALRTRALAHLELALAPGGARRDELAQSALADITRIVSIMEKSSYPYALRAFILRQLGRGKEADGDDALASRYRSEKPSEDESRFDAWLARDKGDYASAISLYSEILARWPNNPEVYADRGEAFEAQGQTAQAINDYRVALGLNPDDVFCLLNLGHLLMKDGSFEEAERYLTRASELRPDNPWVHEALSANFVERGKDKAAKGDGPGALVQFRRAEQESRLALTLAPGSRWSLVNLGASLAEQQRLRDRPHPQVLAEAVGYYQKALSGWDAPTPGQDREVYAAALANTCDGLIQIGSVQKAIEVCDRSARESPESAAIFYNLAGAYALSGRRQDALTALEKDLGLGDRDWETLRNDRWFASLKDDPRFNDIVGRMKRASERK